MANGYRIQYNEDGSWTWEEVDVMDTTIANQYIKQLEETYEKDTTDLRNEIYRLRQENEALKAKLSDLKNQMQMESLRVEAKQQQLRHV